MNNVPNFRFLLLRLWMVSVALAIGLLGQVTSNAVNILLIVNSATPEGGPTNANDQEVADRLTQQGHKVTAVDDDTVSQQFSF